MGLPRGSLPTLAPGVAAPSCSAGEPAGCQPPGGNPDLAGGDRRAPFSPVSRRRRCRGKGLAPQVGKNCKGPARRDPDRFWLNEAKVAILAIPKRNDLLHNLGVRGFPSKPRRGPNDS